MIIELIVALLVILGVIGIILFCVKKWKEYDVEDKVANANKTVKLADKTKGF